MEPTACDSWAEKLWQHRRMATPLPRITDQVPELTMADGYCIQKRLLARHFAAGERHVGWKMGLTSVAKQRSVGVTQPIYGGLTSGMMLLDPHTSLRPFIHPRVEPELAVILNRPLKGPEVTMPDVMRAIDFIIPALEVIDSRYQDFSFTAMDVVADNASAAAFYLGAQAYTPYNREWDMVGVTVYKNGAVQQTATAAAVLGHPLRAVQLLVRMLWAQDAPLEAGTIILTGGITAAVPMGRGDHLTMVFDGLGEIELHAHSEKEG